MADQIILLVEDDRELAELTRDFLENEGFVVWHEAEGKAARDRILASPPDMIILDIMLPGMNGYTVCREVRPEYDGPILFLTARDEELDEILGLEMGGDDYVTKPVRPQLLVARVRALLRRAVSTQRSTASKRVKVGDLIVDANCREARMGERVVDLTTYEFDLLYYLANRAGEVVSRQDIYQALFNYDYDGLDRSVDVYISRLRQKLSGDNATSVSIKTVRSVGYLLSGPANEG
ncbi:MAG: response regulator transcription factor [Gemmatimonadota bacterium]|nr:response regulator transcription factor [Gemmatimonadota bacterium]MDE2829838.1 response regulator transcription factor [Gemmatimonadota bacterium]MDE2954809.1 response regulator transcription factor [Gemmatimonadota bacterium]